MYLCVLFMYKIVLEFWKLIVNSKLKKKNKKQNLNYIAFHKISAKNLKISSNPFNFSTNNPEKLGQYHLDQPTNILY